MTATAATEQQLTGTWVTSGARPVSWLGERVDGWADLLEGMADKASDVVAAFQQSVSRREMARERVTHETSTLTTGATGSKQRVYQLVHLPTGGAVALYIGKFGRDLYLSWDLCVRPIWNKVVIFGILGAAAVLSFLFAQQRNPLTGRSIFSLELFLMITIVLSVLFAWAVMWAGNLIKRDPLAFLVKEIDRFDADDITAMTFAVHQSLLQAAEAHGADASKLRVKERFEAGRRGRPV